MRQNGSKSIIRAIFFLPSLVQMNVKMSRIGFKPETFLAAATNAMPTNLF